jgi:predicted dithiol-disulfide oxidoreductase (DUF899 family)
MSETRYPNESPEYRKARDELLEEEKALVEKVKAVAEKRRQLPLGGRLKEDYRFQWANDGKVGQEIRLSELFGDKPTLILYNFMYGPGWDNPCLSCTSLMDGFDRTAYQVRLPGNAGCSFLRHRQGPRRKDQCMGQNPGMDTDRPGVRLRHHLPGRLPMPG